MKKFFQKQITSPYNYLILPKTEPVPLVINSFTNRANAFLEGSHPSIKKNNSSSEGIGSVCGRSASF
jgi:hypothetical protein